MLYVYVMEYVYVCYFSKLMQAYLSATGAALGVGLGLNAMVKVSKLQYYL